MSNKDFIRADDVSSFVFFCIHKRSELSAESKNVAETATRCMDTFRRLSVINVGTANPLCTYNTHTSVTDLMHAHKPEYATTLQWLAREAASEWLECS